MALIRKLKQILAEAFPPPDKIELRNGDGIIGIVTSKRFRGMGMMDRQTLIDDALKSHGLSEKEIRRIVIIAAVTPEEEQFRAAME
jgi:acid stress-induced BolA-like protein IbaG/YrbA